MQQTSSFCLRRLTIQYGVSSNSYLFDCDAVSGRQILPVPVHATLDRLELKLDYVGTLFLSELTWKSGNLEPRVFDFFQKCSSSPFVMVRTQTKVGKPLTVFSALYGIDINWRYNLDDSEISNKNYSAVQKQSVMSIR